MPNETDNDSITTAEKLHMTERQAEAYNEFIDYMVRLYHEYGHLLEDDSCSE